MWVNLRTALVCAFPCQECDITGVLILYVSFPPEYNHLLLSLQLQIILLFSNSTYCFSSAWKTRIAGRLRTLNFSHDWGQEYAEYLLYDGVLRVINSGMYFRVCHVMV